MSAFEEIDQMNVALRHCSELKGQINKTLSHVRRLDAKYNQTDYAAILANIENNLRTMKERSNRSKSAARTVTPYQKPRQRQSGLVATSPVVTTPPKPIANTPTKQRAAVSKPRPLFISKSNASSSQSLTSLDDCQTPTRSIRTLFEQNNKVSVSAIKVQRELESMIAKLQYVQREQSRAHRLNTEQSIYRSSSNSLLNQVESKHLDSPIAGRPMTSTPNKLKRSKLDESNLVMRRVQVMYGTPLQKMHKRLINLNASLVKTC